MRVYVFDLDDTLYPERAYAFSGFEAVASAFESQLGECQAVALRMKALFDSEHRNRVFNAILEELGVCNDAELVEEMILAFRTHTPCITLHSDAEAVLTRLRTHCKLGIITDGYAVTQHAKVDALRLHDRVDEIIVTDDFGREFWKPHPRAFEEMAKRLDASPEDCVYIGDNLSKDFVAPNLLGWDTICILREDAVHASLPAADGGVPKRICTTLSEI